MNLVNKMQNTGEYSVGDYEPRILELTNSQKAEKFFAGLNNHQSSTGEDYSHQLQTSTQHLGNS